MGSQINMNDLISSIFLIIFIGFMAFVFWSMFSKKGKGRMLGGTIIHTAKYEVVQTEGIAKTIIRAHVIETKTGSKHVGLELSESAKLAVSMTPIKLTKQEAESLIYMVKEVIEKT